MLIDREQVLDCLNRNAEQIRKTLDDYLLFTAEEEKFSWGLGLVESIIADVEELPSAESEVTRCKDCKYHVGEGCCDYWDEGRMFLDISDSDYCSKAERREEE